MFAQKAVPYFILESDDTALTNKLPLKTAAGTKTCALINSRCIVSFVEKVDISSNALFHNVLKKLEGRSH